MKITLYCGDEEFEIPRSFMAYIKTLNKANEKIIINIDNTQRKFTIIDIENIFNCYNEKILFPEEINIYLEEI